jgi:hypothetical protein
MAANEYFPSVRDLVNVDFLPEPLAFLGEKIDTLLSKLFYKDYKVYKNSDGSSIAYEITIISYKEIDLNILESWGIQHPPRLLFRDVEDSKLPLL